MAGYADSSYQFKGLCCTRLETEKYSAIISPLTGCSVIRLFDKINNIEVFRYKDDVTFDTINQAREIWGLPTLYLPNRFDKGIIKTSDGIYNLPINETLFDNYIHGWVHKREHTVEKAFSDGVRAVLETSYTFDETDEMYEYFVKISDMAYDIEFCNNFDITLSPIVKNIDKFNYWLEALPFYMNVQKEGVILSESKLVKLVEEYINKK